jgi:hypothetical protein
MLSWETISLYSKNYMKPINTLHSEGKMQNCLLLKQVGHVVTSGRWRVNNIDIEVCRANVFAVWTTDHTEKDQRRAWWCKMQEKARIYVFT